MNKVKNHQKDVNKNKKLQNGKNKDKSHQKAGIKRRKLEVVIG